MALVLKDRVKETTTTTGTGTLTLAGAMSGFQAFSVIGNANTTYYAIYEPSGTDWEVGIGTYTLSGTTLSRDTILASSNAGAVVNFSAGTKVVFCTYPADKSVYYDASGNVTLSTGGLTVSNGDLTVSSGKATITNTSSGVETDGLTLVNNVASGINTAIALNFQPNDSASRQASIVSVQSTAGNFADLNFYVSNGSTPVKSFQLPAAGGATVTGAAKPNINDGGALGASGTAWSDLFLASGGVINWNAGDVTVTHSSNLLTIGGGNLAASQVAYSTEGSLTSSSNSVAWDAGTYQVATHTLTENTTIAAPSNQINGAFYSLKVVQNASAAKTLAWNAVFLTAAGEGMPTMTTTLSGVDIYTFRSDGTNMYLVGYGQDYS